MADFEDSMLKDLLDIHADQDLGIAAPADPKSSPRSVVVKFLLSSKCFSRHGAKNA